MVRQLGRINKGKRPFIEELEEATPICGARLFTLGLVCASVSGKLFFFKKRGIDHGDYMLLRFWDYSSSLLSDG
jgi:hypothetical protein